MKFTINVDMQDRWVPYFIAFLKMMERNGNIGHSEYMIFMSDGDGDFRPKFKTDIALSSDVVVRTVTMKTSPDSIEDKASLYDAG